VLIKSVVTYLQMDACSHPVRKLKKLIPLQRLQ
jgi:hypothetical protein